MIFTLNKGEKVLRDAVCNKMGSFMGQNGRLILTNHRLVFANRKGSEVRESLKLSEISHVDTASRATPLLFIGFLILFFPALLLLLLRSVRVTVNTGLQVRFAVGKAKSWAADITAAQEKCLAETNGD